MAVDCAAAMLGPAPSPQHSCVHALSIWPEKQATLAVLLSLQWRGDCWLSTEMAGPGQARQRLQIPEANPSMALRSEAAEAVPSPKGLLDNLIKEKGHSFQGGNEGIGRAFNNKRRCCNFSSEKLLRRNPRWREIAG
jgi:hypothetical protein